VNWKNKSFKLWTKYDLKHLQIFVAFLVYIIKEFVQPKMSLNREFLIWKEQGMGVRERERERGVGGRVSRQSYVRLG
jgi:hypothetical protein